MSDRLLALISILIVVMTSFTSGCSSLDPASIPNAKIDVFKMNHPKFLDNYRLNFKAKYLENGWWKEPQRTVTAYMKAYGLIPEECKGQVEILDSGLTENMSLGWARFRCMLH
jgi:hypothetical protein